LKLLDRNHPYGSAFQPTVFSAIERKSAIFRTTEAIPGHSKNFYANLIDKDDWPAAKGMIANCLRSSSSGLRAHAAMCAIA
jgi:hypothetical protein